MANKTTVPLTEEEYIDIITAMRTGSSWFHKNERIALALQIEAEVGIRISDILLLRLKDIILKNGTYRLNIKEKKTGKDRQDVLIKDEIYELLKRYCKENEIKPDELIFSGTHETYETIGLDKNDNDKIKKYLNSKERNIQIYIQKVCEFLGFENISTHSFRKMFAYDIYEISGYDLDVTREAMKHNSVETTRRYLGSNRKINDILIQKPSRLL